MENGFIAKIRNDARSLNIKSLATACSFMATTMLVMCIINLFTGEYTMAVLTGSVGVWFGLSLIVFRKIKRRRQLILCMLIAAYAMFMYFVVSGGVSGFSIVWLLVAPPAAMYCFSLFYGGIFSLVMGISATAYLAIPNGVFGYDYSDVYRTRFPIVYFFITLMCIFIQYHLVSSRDKRSALIEKLEQANRTKGDFLANMSHEIRTPMNAILGMCELVLREDISEEVRENCCNIRNSGESLLSIINDILDFSKIESGKTELIEEEFNIGSIVNDVINMAVTRKGNKKLEIIPRIDPTLPRGLIGDEIRIKQVIVNLVTNALKFTNEGSVVVKITQSRHEYGINLRVSIMDTGIGISEENIEKLFTNFQQVDTRKNRAVEGTGLGLAISKRLIEKMGGFINVYSIYGEGSEFRFCIPLKVSDYEPFIRINKPEDTKVAIYLDTEKYSHPVIMKQYVALVQEISRTYDIPFKLFRSFEELRRGIDSGEYNYCFVAKEEYLRNAKMFDDILKKTHLAVIQDRFNSVKLPENISCVYKPFYVMSFASVLNNESFVVTNDKKHSVDSSVNGRGCRVLIVDDNLINLKVAEGLMKPYDLDIDTAAGGKEAIEMVKQTDYDIVFMDHMMPEMDGVEATQYIRCLEGERYSKLPIVALTANAVNGAREVFVNSGFSDFLAKPIELTQLERVLRAWLPQREAPVSEPTVVSAEDDLADVPEAELDFDKGMEYSAGSPEIYREVLRFFAGCADGNIDLLKKHFEAQALEEYTSTVHDVRCTAMSIGAFGLSQLASSLEEACFDGFTEETSAVHGELIDEYRGVCAAIKRYLSED